MNFTPISEDFGEFRVALHVATCRIMEAQRHSVADKSDQDDLGEIAMRKLEKLIVLASATMISGGASAGSLTGPVYIGARSANVEQETYAYLVTPGREQLLGFLGPARNVGVVAGSAEAATIGYRPLVAVREAGRWLFQFVER